jgi:hypothetical protein
VAQGVGSDFKPQYHKNKTKQNNKKSKKKKKNPKPKQKISPFMNNYIPFPV